jgi:hypothetical protein
MKLSWNNGALWLILILVFTPLAFLLIPLSATLGIIVALVVLIVGLFNRGEHHQA